ncbi:hypothetical protein SAMN05421775_109112 [Jannaschia aquimarina]|nr:hypothetical protein SAMN05421775_109112 [Jannaschia aquimarina]
MLCSLDTAPPERVNGSDVRVREARSRERRADIAARI